jgi:vitamin B12 transporter
VKNRLTLPIAAAIASVTHSALAADEKHTENMLVTATRTEQTLSASLAPATIITSEDIERIQAKNLTQVLERLPSIEIRQSGGPGSNTSLQMRGSNSKATLFLVDGQRINSATAGTTSFQFLNPEQIDRIEIVRGPRASLYGADAIGGVIHIFTKKGSEETESYVKTGVGKDSARQVAFGTSGSSGNWHYAANGSYYETDGIDNRIEKTAPNGDDDAFENQSINANLGYGFDSGASLDLSYLLSDNETEFDDPWTVPAEKPHTEHYIQIISLALTTPVTDYWETKLSVGHTTDDTDNYDDLTGNNIGDFRTVRESLSWQNDFTVNDDVVITLGSDYYDDRITATQSYIDSNGNNVTERDNFAYFAQFQYANGPLDAQLALRKDDNEQYGTHDTGSIALGYQLSSTYKVIASYGEGFKAPTFNDLYADYGWYIGNPDLEPEESENIELEIRAEYSVADVSLNLFRNELENAITYDATSSPHTMINIGSSTIKGAELNTSAYHNGWLANASYTYLDAEEDGTGNTLAYVSRRSAKFDLDKNHGDWDFGIGWRVYSDRYTSVSNTKQLPGYGIVDLRASYQATENLSAQLKLDNVLDKDYQTQDGYNQYGLNWFVTLTYKM